MINYNNNFIFNVDIVVVYSTTYVKELSLNSLKFDIIFKLS